MPKTASDFPQTLYVSKEPVGINEKTNTPVFLFEGALSYEDVAEIGAETIVATYRLVDVNVVTTTINMKPLDSKKKSS